MSELPTGWITCKVDQLFKSFSGGTPSKSVNSYWKGSIPWISSGEFNSDIISEGTEFISKEGLEHSSAKLCSPGSVLIVVRSGILKHTLPVAIVGKELAINQDIKCFDSGDDEINRWLFFNLKKSARDILSLNREGTTVQSVKYDTLKEHELILPPLNEQRRIVAKLEKLLSRVNEAQERLATIPRILKRFRQSVLAAACSGRLTTDWRNQSIVEVTKWEEALDGPSSLPASWQWKSLGSVCEKVVDCPHSTPKWTASGQLCVRTTNFKPGYLDLSERQFVSNQTFIERTERLRPRTGDVLYSREGGILGIACMIPEGINLCLGQRMMLFRTNSNFHPRLLMHWLNGPAILDRVRDLTGGSASPHLNVRDIKNFPTPVPPTDEQQEIVHRVEALFKTADALEARYHKARAYVDKLTQSILAKAFRGELVSQDPNDEPASVLLERIHKSRDEVRVKK